MHMHQLTLPMLQPQLPALQQPAMLLLQQPHLLAYLPLTTHLMPPTLPLQALLLTLQMLQLQLPALQQPALNPQLLAETVKRFS